ncbi:MAG TPA: MAPEG family protein [Gammaproteobacteria bacterium]|nr:MAPEG family protein [Gammaproteobacteria bacterium]
MAYVYLVTLLILLEYLIFGYLVSRARTRYRVVAPAVTGHPQFERYHRVQQNTIEQLVVVLPALWIFGLTLSGLWAAALGLVFVIARAWYAYGYVTSKSGGGRHYGFMLGLYATVALLIGSGLGAVKMLF